MASWAALILAVLQVIGGLVTGGHKIHKHRKHVRTHTENIQKKDTSTLPQG